jgi:hypothetical protein
MKNKFNQALLAACIAIGLATTSVSASAENCRWIHGYWSHGYYHHPHRICWGHRRHCVWHNGVKNCWY